MKLERSARDRFQRISAEAAEADEMDEADGAEIMTGSKRKIGVKENIEKKVIKEEIEQEEKEVENEGKWVRLPSKIIPKPDALSWLLRIQKEYISKSNPRGIYCTTTKAFDFFEADIHNQVDVFIKAKAFEHEISYKSCHVTVVGELANEPAEQKLKFKQLARSMRTIFTHQPTRRFIHGFIWFGAWLELYVFDRSGPYASSLINIHQNPKKVVTIFAGYAMMTDEELGLDTFIQHEGDNRSIVQPETSTRSRMCSTPLYSQPSIVSRATCCFAASLQMSKDSANGL